MSEEQEQKNDWDTDYYFFDHNAKRQHILQRMFEAEELHFQMIVDKLDESHTEYDGWMQTTVQLKEELDRLRYLFKLYGGTLGSEFPVDE
tara:strand:- start:602 stop:871 length:270 start_codon:yes stop_codon:yes gene_type:complete